LPGFKQAYKLKKKKFGKYLPGKMADIFLERKETDKQ